MARLKSASFLDFDNVWISLDKEDPRAAKRFATAPSRWLDALASGQLLPAPEGHEIDRAILVRRCYANPKHLEKLQCRASFTRAGFSVIDCPSLTSSGKNSADIHMVIDMLDTLGHSTHFDEFIVLSADADFTPVLTRIRTHDRRTAVFTNHETAAAFKAVADGMIDLDDMLEVLGSGGGVPTAPVAALTGKIDKALATRIVCHVRGLVAASDTPLRMAGAAQSALKTVGNHAEWAGYGSFGKLLGAHHAKDFATTLSPNDYVYDPLRHDLSKAANAGGSHQATNGSKVVDALPEALRDLVSRIREVSNCPALSTADHKRVLTEFSRQLAEGEFSLTEMSRTARDRLNADGASIARSSIGFIMRGISLSGFQFGVDDSPARLAEAYRRNIRQLCANAGFEMNPEEVALLEKWIAV